MKAKCEKERVFVVRRRCAGRVFVKGPALPLGSEGTGSLSPFTRYRPIPV